MSRTSKILPGPTSRTPSGTNAPAAACRFLESSANAVWEYDRRTQTWSGPTHATPGVPDDNAYHLYIDWYFG